jgi:hypothetical protein
MEDEESPQFVSQSVGVSAGVIRKWIKDAGMTVPSKYKIKAESANKQAKR